MIQKRKLLEKNQSVKIVPERNSERPEISIKYTERQKCLKKIQNAKNVSTGFQTPKKNQNVGKSLKNMH